MSAFTSSSGNNIQVVPSGSTNPTVQNITMTTAGTEYTATLPTGTTQFEIRSRLYGKLQFSYTNGQSGTIYRTLPQGCAYSEAGLLLTAPLAVYVQSSKDNDVLEVVSWV